MTLPDTRRSLHFTGPRQVAVLDEALGRPAAGELLVETIASAISPGSELLVYRDEVPDGIELDSSITALRAPTRYPLKYGYAAVGRVIAAGPEVTDDWRDGLVFALHPHESHFLARPEELERVPKGISADDAALFASVETAVTLVMDGRPMVGERAAVLGQGIVGLLTAALLSRFPLAELATFDLHPLRRRRSTELGAHQSIDPTTGLANLEQTFDLTYELSGNPAALDQAVGLTRFHGRVVIGSWYGRRRAPIDLGGSFHRSRIALLSSQVSTIDPALSGRWSAERRRALTWRTLSELRPARLVTHRFELPAAPDAYELLDHRPDEAIQILITYGT